MLVDAGPLIALGRKTDKTHQRVVAFAVWLSTLRDRQAQATVRIRIRRLESGAFRDCEPVGESVFELREHLGPGYRVYFGRHGRSVVILLCG